MSLHGAPLSSGHRHERRRELQHGVGERSSIKTLWRTVRQTTRQPRYLTQAGNKSVRDVESGRRSADSRREECDETKFWNNYGVIHLPCTTLLSWNP